jgi:hypothetical protein
VSGAIVALGADDQLAGNHAAAIAAATQAAELAAAIGAVDDVAWMWIRRGTARLRSGDLAEARGDLAAARATGEHRRSAAILALADTGLADLARLGGDPAAARTLLAGALARMVDAKGLPSLLQTQALIAYGRAETAAGDRVAARDRLGTALERALAAGERPTIAGVAEALADLAAPAEAARMLGLAAATRGVPDRGNPDVLRTEAAARAALGDRYAAIYQAAAALDVDAAVAAIGSSGGTSGPPPERTPPGSPAPTPATPPPHDWPAGAASGRGPRPTPASPG